MQIGMVTWLLALLAIELALPHHAVWKVNFISYTLISTLLLDFQSRILLKEPPLLPLPDCHKPLTSAELPSDLPYCNLQGWLSGLWQVCVVLLGAAVLALALLTPSHANAQTSPEFELVMEGRSKRTPESSSAAV